MPTEHLPLEEPGSRSADPLYPYVGADGLPNTGHIPDVMPEAPASIPGSVEHEPAAAALHETEPLPTSGSSRTDISHGSEQSAPDTLDIQRVAPQKTLENVQAGPESPAKIAAAVKQTVREIKRRYGIRVSMSRLNRHDKADNVTHVQKLALAEARPALDALREELGKYPPKYIRRLKLPTIRLLGGGLRTVEQGDEPLGGLHSKNGNLYIGSDNTDSQDHIRSTAHHELFHRSDRMAPHIGLGWILNRFSRGRPQKLAKQLDQQWKSLVFRYPIERYVYDRAATAGLYGSRINLFNEEGRPRGYANWYGVLNPLEDRATIAQDLMGTPLEAKSKATYDTAYAKKLQLVQGYLTQRSGGLMDAQFFEDLLNGRYIDEAYWDERQ